MARMNAETRIDLGTKMVESWTAAGFGNMKSCLFVSEMLQRLKSGRGMSAKQREWFDSAVMEPAPQIQNSEKVARLREAAKVVGLTPEKVSALNDFAYRLSRGFVLSEKQIAFMDSLLEQSDVLKVEGPWTPDADLLKEIEIGLKICKKYTSFYLSQCPGLSLAIQNVTNWKLWNGVLDRRYAEMLSKVGKGDRESAKKFSSRFPAGSMVLLKTGELAFILSPALIGDSGDVEFECLVAGKATRKRIDRVSKEKV